MVEDTSQTIKENGLMEKNKNKNVKSKTKSTTMKMYTKKNLVFMCVDLFLLFLLVFFEDVVNWSCCGSEKIQKAG